MEVKAKGFEHPVTLYEALGIGRPHKLYLPDTGGSIVSLAEAVPLRYEIVEANHLGGESYKGSLTKLSPKGAEVRLENPVPILSNLKMHIVGTDGQDIAGALYAKVVGTIPDSPTHFSIRFTSSSPEIETFLRVLL